MKTREYLIEWEDYQAYKQGLCQCKCHEWEDWDYPDCPLCFKEHLKLEVV